MIEFRGKDELTGIVKIGYGIAIIPKYDICSIIKQVGQNITAFLQVNPNTLSQFTGLYDKNGVKIFGSVEIDGKLTKGGDRIKSFDWGTIGDVVWNKEKGAWAIVWELTDSPNRIFWQGLSEHNHVIVIIGKQFEMEETL